MNSILFEININISDFLSRWLQYAFNPYTSILSNLVWGILFGFIGAGIFVGSKSVQTAFTYLVIVGIVFSIILPAAVLAIFATIVVFIAASAFYVIFIEGR